VWDAWHDFLRTIGTTAGWTEELVIGIRYRYESAYAHCRLHPDLAAALRDVDQRGIRVAVLADSHWPQTELDGILERLRFPVEICYAASTAMLAGSGPDPKPFVKLMEHLAIPPQGGAYLGWSRRSLEAARRAQLIAVRFNGTSQAPADVTLHDTRQLARYFERWEVCSQPQAA
jgi:phosphoglycolate phosphatase-like HAD superfamily hydrolase